MDKKQLTDLASKLTAEEKIELAKLLLKQVCVDTENVKLFTIISELKKI